MHVCFLYSSMNKGGAERTIQSISNYLIENGQDVSIIVLAGTESSYKLNSKVNFYRLDLFKHTTGFHNTISKKITMIKKVKRQLSHMDIDVVICFSVVTQLLAVLSNLKRKFKIVGAERNNPYIFQKNTKWYFIKKPLSLLMDGFIFQTIKSSEFYPKKTVKKGVIIPNSVVVSCHKKYSFNNKSICSVGRLENQKDFITLIKAFSIVSKELEDYSLDIYGEGKEKNNLQNLINELNLDDLAHLHGIKDNIHEKMLDSSIFVLSSKYEGMPNALMEAMALGMPVISTNCDMGPEELICHNFNGLLVNVGDYEEMANQIIAIAKNKELANKLSSNAIRIVESNSVSNVGMKYKNYIEQVCK